jgi:DUF177 domain-containing protein
VTGALVIKADDLVGHPGRERPFKGTREVSLRLGDSTVNGPMFVEGVARGTVDGVQAIFTSSAEGHMKCVRCLIEWDQEVSVSGSQHFGKLPDEDGYAISEGDVEIGGPAMDELALALPPAPVHAENCRGLCPNCGNDLNTDPCDGHEDGSDSPFAVLKDLLDS